MSEGVLVNFSDAARVSVSPDLLKLQPLSFKRRRELRYELVKDYILKRPYGTRIKMDEFRKILGMGTNPNASVFINRMVAEGEIVRHNISLRKFFYTVPGEVTVVKPATIEKGATSAPAPAEEFDVKTPELEPTNPVKPKHSEPRSDLEQSAMQYLWYNPDGSVRDFVKWTQSRI